eukprot:m.279492 g.279492  ORF g.279492 m.279492 type:complete len:137 (+) comp19805_c0_seq17:178-588(+)
MVSCGLRVLSCGGAADSEPVAYENYYDTISSFWSQITVTSVPFAALSVCEDAQRILLQRSLCGNVSPLVDAPEYICSHYVNGEDPRSGLYRERDLLSNHHMKTGVEHETKGRARNSRKHHLTTATHQCSQVFQIAM